MTGYPDGALVVSGPVAEARVSVEDKAVGALHNVG